MFFDIFEYFNIFDIMRYNKRTVTEMYNLWNQSKDRLNKIDENYFRVVDEIVSNLQPNGTIFGDHIKYDLYGYHRDGRFLEFCIYKEPHLKYWSSHSKSVSSRSKKLDYFDTLSKVEGTLELKYGQMFLDAERMTESTLHLDVEDYLFSTIIRDLEKKEDSKPWPIRNESDSYSFKIKICDKVYSVICTKRHYNLGNSYDIVEHFEDIQYEYK